MRERDQRDAEGRLRQRLPAMRDEIRRLRALLDGAGVSEGGSTRVQVARGAVLRTWKRWREAPSPVHAGMGTA